MNVVVGSGPSGVAAAAALLARGRDVLMIDAGIEIEPQIQSRIDSLKKKPHTQWDAATIRDIKSKTEADAGGIPEKRVYGSLFYRQETDQITVDPAPGMEMLSSLAKGGLSNVWGASVLPYSKTDVAGWPLRWNDLAPHFEAVTSLFDLCAVSDDLAPLYPLFSQSPRILNPSSQAQDLLDDLEQNKDALRQRNIHFGRSRLAMRLKNQPCVYCGLCLYGCPYGLIHSTAYNLPELEKDPRFKYRGNLVVERIRDRKDGVGIEVKNRGDGQSETIEAERVFLACGPLSSTRILLESLGAYDTPLRLKTNQHFILPLLRFHGGSDPTTENLHTLSQVFIEFIEPGETSEDNVHLQVYTYNDLYREALQKSLGVLYRTMPALFDQLLLDRLLIVQGYLHSKYSPEVEVKLDPQTRRLKARLIPNRRTRRRIGKASRRLLKNSLRIGGVPMMPMLRISPAGGGAHMGGTFPMREKPGPFESDVLGRPHGFERTHVVDSTVFPAIPPNTITLSVMANAHRIASLT